MNVDGLTRKNLDELTVEVLRPGARARPDVRLVLVDGRRLVVKDYSANGTAFKKLLGIYLVWRERTAMIRAAGVEGVPAVSGELAPYALVTEHFEAAEALTAPVELLDEEFFERLTRLVQSLHERGVVHADLKNLSNILVTADGHPRLVDFTSAFTTGSNPLTALLFPWLSQDDMKAIYKLKKRRVPHLLTADEEALLEERSLAERAFRWARRYVRYAVKLCSTPEHERSSIRLK